MDGLYMLKCECKLSSCMHIDRKVELSIPGIVNAR